jgi:hypothetical protein
VEDLRFAEEKRWEGKFIDAKEIDYVLARTPVSLKEISHNRAMWHVLDGISP